MKYSVIKCYQVLRIDQSSRISELENEKIPGLQPIFQNLDIHTFVSMKSRFSDLSSGFHGFHIFSFWTD